MYRVERGGNLLAEVGGLAVRVAEQDLELLPAFGLLPAYYYIYY